MPTSSIPIACYGRHGPTGEGVRQAMLPEFDLVHMACDLATGKSEFSRLFNGDTSVLPALGVGSNIGKPEQERRIPRAVICGAGVPAEEFDELKAAVTEETVGKEIHWYKVYPGDVKKYIPAEAQHDPSKGPPDGKYIALFFKDQMKGLLD